MKLGIIIGRFAPLHEGHKHLIREASKKSDKVIILVGSSNKPRTIRTPWTYEERSRAITSWLALPSVDLLDKVSTFPINDYSYNDSIWISQVQSIIESKSSLDSSVTLFGHEKDDTDYLRWFHDWKLQLVDSTYPTSGTEQRMYMFNSKPFLMPETVLEDWKYFKNEAETFKNYPFPDTLNFNCADSIVVCGGHVLLIERKIAPGRGTWALPGGFKNRNESFTDCAIRELVEETNIRVAEKVLRGSIKKTKLFDSPKRGNGIPRNTLAVLIEIEINNDGTLPRVSPADDSVNAKWVKLSDIQESYKLFDDHFDILINMGVL